MTFLAAIPIWGYFIILAVTFMVVHVLALRADQPQNRVRSIGGRVVSSLVLLLALLFLDPTEPASILLALFAAAVAGFISGRTATPPLPPRAADTRQADAPNDASAVESSATDETNPPR